MVGKAIVIGGSLGGLMAANLLLRAGWEVDVHERVADELEGRGAGVVTHPELLETLRRAGLSVDDSIGVTVQERITLGPDGRRLGSRVQPQMLTAWARLYSGLREAFPDERYHNGKQLTALAQDEHCVTARFSDGSTASGDILVAADGMRSTVRQAVLPDVRPVYAGYVAWRGLVEEADLSFATRQEAFPYFAFGLPPHEQMIAYPVAGRKNAIEPGRRRYNFVWYRPAKESTTLRQMLTDASGKVWPEGIPPPLVRPEFIDDAIRAARRVLAPQFVEVVEKAGNLFFQPIFDLESSRLSFGRVALLGDAAFVARPHCGMGVTKAGGDAEELVRALSETDGAFAALKAYEAARLGFGRRTVAHARDLGAYMQAQLRTSKEIEMAERYRTPEAVMRETAMPLTTCLVS